MKGTVKPEETYSKVKNVSEAHTLELNIGSDMDEKLYVLTEIVKALITTGNYPVTSPKFIVDAAEKVADEIIKRAKQ